MAQVADSPEFKALVMQASAVLLTRGLTVEPVAVHGVARYMIDAVAERMSLAPAEALGVVAPEVIAQRIAEAADPSVDGAQKVHSVRPVRADHRTVGVPRQGIGHLLMALSQSAKYAIGNGDTRAADHAVDLSTEIGAALVGQEMSMDSTPVPVAVVDEAVSLIEATARHLAEGIWSSCQCGDDHGQSELDGKVVQALQADAGRARRLRAQLT